MPQHHLTRSPSVPIFHLHLRAFLCAESCFLVLTTGLVSYINNKLGTEIDTESDEILEEIKPGILLWFVYSPRPPQHTSCSILHTASTLCHNRKSRQFMLPCSPAHDRVATL